MPSFVTYALVCFGSLFSIVDPFAALPIFLALAGGQPRPIQARTAFRASLTCFTVLTTFGLAGTFIFDFFSITIAAFKIAGGILLFGVGLEMMRARHSETRSTSEEQAEAETKEDVEKMIREDPFGQGGVFVSWTIRPWNLLWANQELMPA